MKNKKNIYSVATWLQIKVSSKWLLLARLEKRENMFRICSVLESNWRACVIESGRTRLLPGLQAACIKSFVVQVVTRWYEIIIPLRATGCWNQNICVYVSSLQPYLISSGRRNCSFSDATRRTREGTSNENARALHIVIQSGHYWISARQPQLNHVTLYWFNLTDWLRERDQHLSRRGSWSNQNYTWPDASQNPPLTGTNNPSPFLPSSLSSLPRTPYKFTNPQ
jgi:hypothetical protein